MPLRQEHSERAATTKNELDGHTLADFNKILLRAIEETIVGLTGPSVLDSLYAGLQKFHSITRDMLPNNLQVLSGILSTTFGPNSSRVVTRRIAVALYARLKIRFTEYPDYDLVAYVEEAKRLAGISSKALET